MSNSIELRPIGLVRSPVTTSADDIWGGVCSRIEIDETMFTPDCLLGLEQFSHVEIIFHFDQAAEDEICRGARHPRGREDWPQVGIFAQRGKNRPNRIGTTVCRLLGVGELSIEVGGLDAVDGTPVLDIKPYMREFAPRGEVHQPQWATELMAQYWNQE